jgi:hypothetical protein
MRMPSELTPWFTTDQLMEWVKEAPDKTSYQRRLAVWPLALVRIPPGLLAKNHPPRAVPFPGSAPFRLSWLTHPPCRYRGVDRPSFGLERPEAF